MTCAIRNDLRDAGSLDCRRKIDLVQKRIDIGMLQEGIDVDPVEQLVHLDSVEESIDIDSSQQGVDVNVLQDDVRIDEVENPLTCTAGSPLDQALTLPAPIRFRCSHRGKLTAPQEMRTTSIEKPLVGDGT